MTQTANEADARFWDRLSSRYARSQISDMPGYERTLERTGQLLTATDRVLELGCGTGTSALRLAPATGHIRATDVSPKMIAIAREKLAASTVSNLTFETAAADDIAAPDGPPAGRPDGSYDAVLAFNLLHLVGDRTRTLADVRRLLKPGGLFISKTACLSEMNPLIRYAVPVMRRVGFAPTVVATFTAAELEREIAAAGFAIEETARHGSGKRDPKIFIVARRG
ncbi:MAG: class I SAM-dependent methyltransferase [Hyphomicrobiaceae bacterium]|nr:class I SAM-dependent methyltransferase [Hyphomicrobiaceae bacterium]